MPLQITELLHPIAGPNPGGGDVRHEQIFRDIKQARTEEEDLPTGDWSRARKTADYALVVKLASDVLSTKSKDLQVAAWLTEALLKREGFAGLASGLDVIGGLLRDHWDHLYPEIEDDDVEYRAAPLEWVGQYLNPAVRVVSVTKANHSVDRYRESRSVGYERDADTSDKAEARSAAIAAGKLSAEDFDLAFDVTTKAWYKQLVSDIDAALRSLDTTNKIAQEKFGHAAPRLSPLRDAVQELRRVAAELLARKLELDPDPVALEPEPDFMAVGGEGEAGGGGLPVVPRNRSDAEARIAAAARFLRAEDSAHPAPYLLLRGFRWGELRGRGEVDPRLLAAPPTELRTRLRGLLLDGRWAELLEQGEDVMASPFGRGWLDLQRYILSACAGLGSDYDQVAGSIQSALRSLLMDVPQLPTLTLMDDTPTANVETQRWLHNLNLTSEEAAPAAPAVRDSVGDGSYSGRAVLEKAMQRVKAGEPEKAIELLINQSVKERSARDRFLRKSQAARIMVDVGRDVVALPILEDLRAEIEKHSLEEWESPEITAQTLGLLYRCLVRTQGESGETQSLYLRICRLDPLQALQIAGKPDS